MVTPQPAHEYPPLQRAKMNTQTLMSLKVLKELRLNGAILTLRRARKAHYCDECKGQINPGEDYCEEVKGGGGLGWLKFPNRIHLACPDKSASGGKK